ncbi:MAG: phosphorylcholine transferase LicD, partial [Oscillospiraceae bacterium]
MDVIKVVQQVEVEILETIHNFCVENNIKYSLAYGTLIGAVRHKGFIPWDDDIDICMLREDYERFIKLWQENPPSGFILQNIDTDEDFTQNMTKIRKDHTTFIQSETEREKHYHRGIFVDIFPADRVPQSKLARKWQFFCAALKLLYSRRYGSGSSNKILSAGEKLLLKAVSPKNYPKYRKWADRQVQKWNGNPELQITLTEIIMRIRQYHPHDLFDEMILLPFEGKEFYCFKQYDKYLTTCYGDY